MLSGVPRGSILGLLLFNIFLCNLFLEHEDCCFTNYADDTNSSKEVIENLTSVTQNLFTGFANNQMKATMTNITYYKVRKRKQTSNLPIKQYKIFFIKKAIGTST